MDIKTANTVVSDEYSSVRKSTLRKQIHIEPWKYQGSLQEAVQKCLTNQIGHYSDEFQGILLAYENTQLNDNTSECVDDQGIVLADITAVFYIFQPFINSLISGIVTRVQAARVSCLVHGTMVASVIKSSRDEDSSWCDSGDEIIFLITKVTISKKRGAFVQGEFQSIRKKGACIPLISDEQFNEEEGVEPSLNQSSSKSKRKRHDTSLNNEEFPKPSKKKKKFNDSESFQDLGTPIDLAEECGEGEGFELLDTSSDSPNPHKGKKNKKKRKQDPYEDSEYTEDLTFLDETSHVNGNSLLEESGPSKKKHKKKKGSKHKGDLEESWVTNNGNSEVFDTSIVKVEAEDETGESSSQSKRKKSKKKSKSSPLKEGFIASAKIKEEEIDDEDDFFGLSEFFKPRK